MSSVVFFFSELFCYFLDDIYLTALFIHLKKKLFTFPVLKSYSLTIQSIPPQAKYLLSLDTATQVTGCKK